MRQMLGVELYLVLVHVRFRDRDHYVHVLVHHARRR